MATNRGLVRRLARLLKIQQWPGPISSEVLANEFGVSRSTIQRDLAKLRSTDFLSDRTLRILRLHQILQESEPRPASSLAEALQVSRRTVFRDLQALREAGVDIRHDSLNGFYRIGTALSSDEPVAAIVSESQSSELTVNKIAALSQIAVSFCEGTFSPSDVTLVLEYLSLTYRLNGGNGLRVTKHRRLQPQMVEVP